MVNGRISVYFISGLILVIGIIEVSVPYILSSILFSLGGKGLKKMPESIKATWYFGTDQAGNDF